MKQGERFIFVRYFNVVHFLNVKIFGWTNFFWVATTFRGSIRLWYMSCAIARACLCTCLKHWRRAKKSTPCLIKKASRRAADRTSKTTTSLIFHFLWNKKILQENHVYLFVISLIQWWKLYCQKQPPEVFCIKRCS